MNELKLFKYLFTVFLCLACIQETKANDTLVSFHLLEKISKMQPQKDGVFPKGIFPSYRTYALNKDRQKADINPFFTGLIIFTLQQLKNDLTPFQQQLVNSIISTAKLNLQKFKNQKGRDTYNFWPTDSPQIFPNGGWLNWFNRQQALPDDMDDTVILLLALEVTDSVANNVHTLMQSFTNNQLQVNNTFKEFQHIPAYSTWFGKKMPVDFDVSVLANILYFVQTRQLKWTTADSASLNLIIQVIKEKYYLSHPAYISPHYNSSAIILYHISRLMQIKPIPVLESYKAQLLDDTRKLLLHADNLMEKIILQTTLIRWGEYPETIQLHTAKDLTELIEEEQFSFFIANMASMLPDRFKQIMSTLQFGKFTYYCPSYNYLLLLENIILHQRKSTTLMTAK